MTADRVPWSVHDEPAPIHPSSQSASSSDSRSREWSRVIESWRWLYKLFPGRAY
jgi:hypothetical protein